MKKRQEKDEKWSIEVSRHLLVYTSPSVSLCVYSLIETSTIYWFLRNISTNITSVEVLPMQNNANFQLSVSNETKLVAKKCSKLTKVVRFPCGKKLKFFWVFLWISRKTHIFREIVVHVKGKVVSWMTFQRIFRTLFSRCFILTSKNCFKALFLRIRLFCFCSSIDNAQQNVGCVSLCIDFIDIRYESMSFHLNISSREISCSPLFLFQI